MNKTITMKNTDTLINYLHRLEREDDLTSYQRLNFICEINNEISHIMHWRKVYHIRYEYDKQMFEITGFPEFGYPEYFRVNKDQTEYLLHKMGYKYAEYDVDDKNVLSLKLYKHGFDDDDHVRVEIHRAKPSLEIPYDYSDNCNLLGGDNL